MKSKLLRVLLTMVPLTATPLLACNLVNRTTTISNQSTATNLGLRSKMGNQT